MTKRLFEIQIAGSDVSPETMDWDDLCDLVGSLRDATSALAESKGFADTEEVQFSLVGIDAGSTRLRLAVVPAILAAAATISEVIHTGDYRDLPMRTRQALHRVSHKTTSRGWELAFVEDKANGIAPGRISADHRIPAPPAKATTQGTTTVYGRCLRVGGAGTPKAEIRLTSGNLIHIDVSEEMARVLARSLYEEVALDGQATWDADSGLKSFAVTRITEYRSTDPIDAFAKLSASAGQHWDNIDAEAFVRNLRYGEPA